MTFEAHRHGISDNLEQFSHQLFQVLLVGMTLGLMRTVVPALADYLSEWMTPHSDRSLSFLARFGLWDWCIVTWSGRQH